MDNATVVIQSTTRFTLTSLQVGQQGATGLTGPTGAGVTGATGAGATGPTGPVGQASQLSHGVPGTQSMAPSGSLAIVNLSSLPDTAQSTGNTGFTYNPGTYLFTNVSQTTIPISANYLLSLNVTSGGYSAVGLTILGTTTYYGGTYNINNAVSNTCNILVPPQATVGLYYMDNATVTIQITSRLTITSLQVGQQGPTGTTGPMGPTGPAIWSATGSNAPYNTVINYSQGYVGVGPSGTYLQTTRGGATAGTGSTVPQYHLDVAGTVRNSVNLFADNSAMVSATPALDYTTFGQNWTANSLPASGYYGCAMSATGQYQVATLSSGGIYYSSNYGQTWILSSGVVFYGIGLSASGQYGAACASGSPFNIYISSNYGQTWTSTGQALAGSNGRVAISASGQYITAVPQATGFIYRSSNYGSSWTTAGSSLTWYSVAMSASGQYQVASTNQASQSCYYSFDYGQTWTATTGAPSGQQLWTLTMSASGQYACLATISSGMYYSSTYGQTWVAASGATTVMTVVAMSASGQYAICASANTNPNYIYYSTNYGQTWTASSYSSASGQNWYGCAISSNGQYLLTVNASAINAVQSTTRFPPLYTNQVQAPLITYADNSAAITATPALDYNTFGQNWTAITTNGANWQTVAVSASGSYVSAAGSGVAVWYSTNYGQTFTLSSGTSGNITSIAMSASGQYQVASVYNSIGIYYSNNYGVSWTLSNAPVSAWWEVAMSASGSYVSACSSTAGSVPYYSTNYGVTWIASSSVAGSYQAIAMSASGQYQVAAIVSGGIYYSSNYGVSWTVSNISNVGTVQYGAMSASGQYATVVTNASGVFISSNYGLTWTQITAVIGTLNLLRLSVSSSGQYQVTSAFGTGIYYSTNYGTTWVQGFASALNWYGLGMSANGQYCLNCAYGGLIYQSITRFPPQSITSQSTTTSTALSLLAPNIITAQNVGIVLGRSITSNYATIGFQYIGDGSTANYVGIGVTAPTTLCIAGTGNVGIGITNPSTLLHVNGAVTIGTSLTFSTTSQINLAAGINWFIGGNKVGYFDNPASTWRISADVASILTLNAPTTMNLQIGTSNILVVNSTSASLTGSLSVLGAGTNVIANPNITGSNGVLNIVRTGASTNYGTSVHFGLASGSTPASFDNYGLIMGGSNGTLASYTGFICLDICNAQNSFYGLTTPSNSSIYADTTQIRFNILSSNKMTILANGNVSVSGSLTVGGQLFQGSTPYSSGTFNAGASGYTGVPPNLIGFATGTYYFYYYGGSYILLGICSFTIQNNGAATVIFIPSDPIVKNTIVSLSGSGGSYADVRLCVGCTSVYINIYNNQVTTQTCFYYIFKIA
jgi:hypothetical protein